MTILNSEYQTLTVLYENNEVVAVIDNSDEPIKVEKEGYTVKLTPEQEEDVE
ncbi:hypothetical protein [Macrococcus animalis]|uniref:hypothetical protein n=1 Tax=Macrococcus animalis TaxID=3395467 RepID=UPI0039BE3FAA